MRRVVLFLTLLFISTISFAQIEKVELTTEELKELTKRKTESVFDHPNIQMINEYEGLKKNIYFVDLYYNNNLLWRESMKKWNPLIDDGGIYYISINPVINFKKIPSELALELMGKEMWGMREVEGEKFLYKFGYNVFDRGELTKTKFDVKFYKLIEK